MSYSLSLVDKLKSGSTISLHSHDPKNVDMLRPRTSIMLPARGPALPAFTFDLSSEIAHENQERRQLHSAVLSENPGAFRRQQKPESASAFVHTINLNKDLLEGMHALKDPKDINKDKKFTRSILFEKQERERSMLEEYHYDHMAPLEDFIRPEDSTSLRKTGYEHGHIRSILKLDTYGPANSAAVLKDRAVGKLPPSPNLDRHAIVSPQYPLRPGKSVPGSANSNASTSSNMSFPLSDDSSTRYSGAFPSLSAFRRSMSVDQNESQVLVNRKKTHNNNDDIGKLFHPSSATLQHDPPDSRGRSPSVRISSPGSTSFAGPLLSPPGSRNGLNSSANSFPGSRGSARFPDNTFAGKAITERERILKDPFLRRHAWFKSYKERLENQEARRKYRKEKRNHRKEQKQVAQTEKDVIKDFENHLVLAIYEP